MSHELLGIEPSRLLAVRAVLVRVIEQVFQLLDPSLWKKNRRGEGDREREREKERNLVSDFQTRAISHAHAFFFPPSERNPRGTQKNTSQKREERGRKRARVVSLADDDDDFYFCTCIFSHPFFRWTTSLFASGIFLSFSSSSFSSSSSSS